MYLSTTASIAFVEKYSKANKIAIGLKQGDSLSTTLINIYINDHPLKLEKKHNPYNPSHFAVIYCWPITAPKETELH